MSILVVEDDRALAQVFQLSLESAGFAVLNVGSCSEAVDALMRQEILLVVLDMNLPDAPGTQVLDYIESEPALTHIPTIVLTAYTRFSNQGNRQSVFQVLNKPITAGMLIKTVNSALE